jgi:hypothetical protein
MITMSASSKESQIVLWIWTCHCCMETSATTTTPSCTNVDCQHTRCEECHVEQHEEPTETVISSHSDVDIDSHKRHSASHSRKRGLLSSQTTGYKLPKNSKSKSKLKPNTNSDQHHIFACPFHKKDPHIYNQHFNSNYFRCTKTGWTECKNLVK